MDAREARRLVISQGYASPESNDEEVKAAFIPMVAAYTEEMQFLLKAFGNAMIECGKSMGGSEKRLSVPGRLKRAMRVLAKGY